jgi:hypothetical protein
MAHLQLHPRLVLPAGRGTRFAVVRAIAAFVTACPASTFRSSTSRTFAFRTPTFGAPTLAGFAGMGGLVVFGAVAFETGLGFAVLGRGRITRRTLVALVLALRTLVLALLPPDLDLDRLGCHFSQDLCCRFGFSRRGRVVGDRLWRFRFFMSHRFRSNRFGSLFRRSFNWRFRRIRLGGRGLCH